jgi:hypothetical protein
MKARVTRHKFITFTLMPPVDQPRRRVLTPAEDQARRIAKNTRDRAIRSMRKAREWEENQRGMKRLLSRIEKDS